MESATKTALSLAGELNETRINLAAYRRFAYALGAELGLKPKEVELAIEMAKAGVREDLTFREETPGLYVGGSIERLVNEPGKTAAAKGKPYVDEVMKEY